MGDRESKAGMGGLGGRVGGWEVVGVVVTLDVIEDFSDGGAAGGSNFIVPSSRFCCSAACLCCPMIRSTKYARASGLIDFQDGRRSRSFSPSYPIRLRARNSVERIVESSKLSFPVCCLNMTWQIAWATLKGALLAGIQPSTNERSSLDEIRLELMSTRSDVQYDRTPTGPVGPRASFTRLGRICSPEFERILHGKILHCFDLPLRSSATRRERKLKGRTMKFSADLNQANLNAVGLPFRS